jgi:hypothetical protein
LQIKIKIFSCHTAESKTSQTGGQWYSDTSRFSIPCFSGQDSKVSYTVLCIHAQMQCFQNVVAHFATALSFARKMFKKFTPVYLSMALKKSFIT